MLLAGVVQSYVVEEWVHHSVHFYNFRSPYFRYMKKHHFYHHTSPGMERGFGLTSGLWDAAFNFVRQHRDRTIAISELFELWRQPPFGVKDGLMPILAVAFTLSHSIFSSAKRRLFGRPGS